MALDGEWVETIGRLYGMNEQYNKSVTMFRRSIEHSAKQGSVKPVQISLARTNLALSLWRAEKKDEARKELTEALTVINAELPPEHQARKRATDLAKQLGIKQD